ncbi:MAG: hypothetical protein QM739_07950 [Propionivibrio sp.]
MKIEQSSVAMSSCHSFSSECEIKVESTGSFRALIDGAAQVSELSVLNDEARQRQLLLTLESLIARMLEFITGNRQSKIGDLREIVSAERQPPSMRQAGRGRQTEMEWTTETTESISERESTDFVSTGKVQTADGRMLDFTLTLGMCREFSCERKTVTVEKAVLRDPLVINFGGKAAALSGKCFAFDLDCDGLSESLAALADGSAYLAFDANEDGRINDGGELFGTKSGNGFADLARFDLDGNRWIDENDAVFTRLRIWAPDGDGQGTLSTLAAHGVGALYLDSAATPFSLTDSENRLLAEIRASGIYLREDGGVGTLQQVDLAV